MAPLSALFFTLCGDYFLLHSLGVTQVPEALATTMGSSRKSAAEALMSFLETTTFLASNTMQKGIIVSKIISRLIK
jgi:hypothetical protein